MNFMFANRSIVLVIASIAAIGTAIAGSDIAQSTSAAATHSSQSSTEFASSALVPIEVNATRANTLKLRGLDGTFHSLDEWKGKVVVLNFWATWCSPCLSEIREFVIYQEQYKTQGLQIVGVGLDDEKKLRNVQRSLEISYPVLVADPKKNGTLMELWGNVSGIVPYSVVIDRKGRLVYSQRGQIDRDSFNEIILPLLGAAESNPI